MAHDKNVAWMGNVKLSSLVCAIRVAGKIES